MYLALIVLIVSTLVIGTFVSRAIKNAIRQWTGGRRKDEPSTKEESEPKKDKMSEKEQKNSEEKTESMESQQQNTEAEVFTEEQTARLDSVQGSGITEDFWNKPSKAEIDSKKIADACVRDSSLTYMEVNNRDLAGDDFMGFNLIIEQNSRMVLTYNAQAVATLTRVEKTVKSEADGKTVETKTVHYRTNVFPPRLAKGMVPRDIERMLSAASEIRAAEGDPELVIGRMTSLFCSAENVESFKRNVVPKVQAKESRPKVQERDDTQHKTRLTRVNK